MEKYFVNIEDINKTIKGTLTKQQWIAQCLVKNCPSFLEKVKESKILAITETEIGCQKGFISRVYRLTIDFDDIDTEPFKCVLKIPTSTLLSSCDQAMKAGEDSDDEFITPQEVAMVHNQECKFYNSYSKINDFKMGKVYGTQDIIVNVQEGRILMEDLSSNGTNLDTFRTFNIYQVESVFNQIVEFQTFFITSFTEDWKQNFNSILNVKDLPFFAKFALDNWEKIKTFLPSSMYSDIEDHFFAMISNWEDIFIHNNNLIYRPSALSVLAHGDLYSNNVIFKIDESGNPVNEVSAIIDFQGIHENNVGYDISKLLFFCTSPDVRHEAERKLLPKIYKKLKKNVLSKGIQFDMSYELYYETYLFSSIHFALADIAHIGFSLEQYNQNDDYIWKERRFNLANRICKGIRDASDIARVYKPDWLSLKI
uniref:CHK domain-containing protein n=1 Tax=Rhabditophanes sp. KR3021 TaxID=114890 RepID=A0AC35UBS2_9BILA